MEEKISLLITLPRSLAGVPIRFEISPGSRNIALNFISETEGEKKYLLIWNQTDYLKVDGDDILWIEAEGSYSRIHYRSKRPMIVSVNLSAIMNELPHDRFIRTHRSYIVNMKNIISLSGNNVRVDDKYIPIGREYRKEVLQHFSFIGVRKNHI